MAFLNMLNGSKTYIAAAGLAGLGVFQILNGQIPVGLQTLFSALATAGLRCAISGLKS